MNRILLLVEDNENDMILASRIVKIVTPNCKIVNYPTGESALRYLQLVDELPDLILIDLKLPGMSGIDLIKEIRTEPRYSHIPIAILTGLTTEIIRAHALNIDLEYIIKPMGVEDYKNLLGKLRVAYA